MADLRLRVQDVSASRVCEIEAPDDVPIERIMVLLVERLELPLNSPDGQLISYKLHHKSSGRQLQDHKTLSEACVATGDVLRLQPEITAGRGTGAF